MLIRILKKVYCLIVAVRDWAMLVVLGGPYRKNMRAYKELNTRKSFQIERAFRYPILLDRYASAGDLGSYFWQDLWAARLIHEANPDKHFDIGSRIDGFIAHLASFRGQITLIDIRPLDQKIPGVDFIQADATNLEAIPDNSIESLSSLCALEHFGLGRYGDAVDPEACFKAFTAIERVIQPGGKAYISVPIGKEHIEFDAHRVFYAQTVVDSFPQMRLLQFAMTNGKGEIVYAPGLHAYDTDVSSRGVRFGLFLLEKNTPA